MGKRLRLTTIGTLLATMAGCGVGPGPQPLAPSQFVRRQGTVGSDPVPPTVGQTSVAGYGELHAPLLPDEYSNLNPTPPIGIAPMVRQQAPVSGKNTVDTSIAQPEIASTAPASAPATAPAPASSPRGYEVVGTVLAQVKDKPIYADKVLATLGRELAADARLYDPELFRRKARQEIFNRQEELIRSQLQVSAAEESLTQEYKTAADMFAQAWRRQQINAAGGSEQVARQRAQVQGSTLEDQVKDQYETRLVQLWLQQRVFSKIQVTAADMRRYYQEHLDGEFTEHAAAKFRLIKTDFDRPGGKAEAAKKVDEILGQLRAGTDDFADLASKSNDWPNNGVIGWVNKGDFKIDDVEKEVWTLRPGQYTDHPIDYVDPTTNDGAFYLAYLEARKPGRVQAFDDPAVQRQIENTLSRQQFTDLQLKQIAELERNAQIVRVEGGLDAAVAMAMQRYPAWAATK